MDKLKTYPMLKKILTKKIVYKTICGTLLITSLSNIFIPNKNKFPIKLSKTTYKSIYEMNDSFSTEQIIKLKNPLTETITNYSRDQLDLNINQTNLNKVKKIRYNGNTSDINDLLFLPNIEEIELLNYQDLSTDEKNKINNLKNLKKIKLIVDSNNLITQEIINSFNENISIKIGTNNSEDLEKLYIYYIYNKLDKDLKNRVELDFSKEDLQIMKDLSKKLKNIISSFNFDKESEEEKIITIAYYITKKLEYDSRVTKTIENAKENGTTLYLKTDPLITEYNNNILQSVIDSESKKGICTNFAGLFFALCLYSNISMKYVEGYYIEEGHAWCTYNYKEKPTIIDITFLDNNPNFFYKMTLLQELECEKEDYSDFIKKTEDILINEIITDESEKAYNNYKQKDNSILRDNITYINERYKEFIKGNYIKYTKLNEIIYFLLILEFILLNNVNFKEQEKKQLKKTRNESYNI